MTDEQIVKRYNLLDPRDRTRTEWEHMIAASARLGKVRIADNPTHPHYGPVRRLWVMLAGLDLLDVADDGTFRYDNGVEMRWDEWLAYALAEWPGKGESYWQRLVLRHLIERKPM